MSNIGFEASPTISSVCCIANGCILRRPCNVETDRKISNGCLMRNVMMQLADVDSVFDLLP